jgi:hypothetical protein
VFAGIAHNDRDSGETGTLGSTPPALAGDELKKPVVERPHNQRLNDAMGTDGTGQFVEGFFVEVLPRLVRIRKDPFDIYVS